MSEFNSDRIKYLIEPGSIEWEMDWSGTKHDGTRQYPDKPEKEMMFEQEKAIAHLLINDVIFVNSHHWKKDWPEEARKATSLNVNCNDIFAWGCADSEELCVDDDEVETLYRMWKANPSCGAEMWCMIKRREMPQDPVAECMRAAGVDLDSFQKEHSLRTNYYSGFSGVIAKFKYDTYIEWCHAKGCDGRPFDKQWWNGWEEFTTANPSWEKEFYEGENKRQRKEFEEQNGWERGAS